MQEFIEVAKVFQGMPGVGEAYNVAANYVSSMFQATPGLPVQNAADFIPTNQPDLTSIVNNTDPAFQGSTHQYGDMAKQGFEQAKQAVPTYNDGVMANAAVTAADAGAASGDQVAQSRYVQPGVGDRIPSHWTEHPDHVGVWMPSREEIDAGIRPVYENPNDNDLLIDRIARRVS